MPKRFQVGELVWWVNSEDWTIQKVEITEIGVAYYTIRIASPARYIYYVKPGVLYREEGAALLTATTSLSNLIERATRKLDALFEKCNAFQQRLYPEPQGTNTHG